MSPTITSVIISSNTPGIGYRIIDAHGITNTQIIVSKTIRGERFSYNFNGDVEDNGTMKLTYGMNELFNLPIGNYKRTIAPDCSYINIFPCDGSETIDVPETSEAWPVNNDSNANNDSNSQVIRTNDVIAVIEY